MEPTKKWYNECMAHDLVETLNKKGYDGIYAATAEEARPKVSEILTEGATVATGGSVTLNETHIFEDITSGKYQFIERYKQPSFEVICDKYREGFFADFFVTSSNAITKDGELVNMDCTGNRTGCIAFGPKKVIIIIGTNKIVDDIGEGIKRCKQVAIMNAKRIKHTVPCNEDAVCHDCDRQLRVCNVTSIVHNCYKFPKRISVIVVPEELGY